MHPQHKNERGGRHIPQKPKQTNRTPNQSKDTIKSELLLWRKTLSTSPNPLSAIPGPIPNLVAPIKLIDIPTNRCF